MIYTLFLKTDRTWQSLRERYLHRIRKNFKSYRNHGMSKAVYNDFMKNLTDIGVSEPGKFTCFCFIFLFLFIVLNLPFQLRCNYPSDAMVSTYDG